MRLLVCSILDKASVNIKETLLDKAEWMNVGEFQGHPVLRHDDNLLVSIDQFHLYADNVDEGVRSETGQHFDHVVFLSRHKAASGIHTLTVHPLGNYEKAEYGGRERSLVSASPHLMTSLLRRLRLEASQLPFQVSFEVTHHGPYLETPSMFIEIGSDESMWGDRSAAGAIAASILNLEETAGPIAIGIGGGHYAPRFSEVVMSKRISFGHMIPNYFIEKADEESSKRLIRMALEKSGEVGSAYIHKKSMKRSRATSLKNLVEDFGLDALDSEDLSDMDS